MDRQAILERYSNRLPPSASSGDRTPTRGSESRGPSTLRGSGDRTPEVDGSGRSGGAGGSDPSDRTGRTERTERTSRSGATPDRRGSDAGRLTDPTVRAGTPRSADRGSNRTGDRGSRTSNRGDDRTPQRRAQDNTRALRDLTSVNPKRADEITRVGQRVSDATSASLSIGIGISLSYGGCYSPWYSGWGLSWGHWYNGWYVGGGYPYYAYCGGYAYSPYCHPYSWPYYWCYGSFPYYISSWYPNYYQPYYSPPIYYASVITTYASEPYYVEAAQETVYVEEEPSGYYGEPLPVGEAVAENTGPAQMPAPADSKFDSNARASGQYLTLGDQAFRDGRYADSVHFYARAVEYAPDEGILYLVLSDGLFATGDYHYGAYALRKAFELDPTLAASDVDKHGFYTDPVEFDRQLAVLEGFVLDHPADADARLMLAANYLFGERPAEAVDLLEVPEAATVRGQDAGALLLAAARERQYGR